MIPWDRTMMATHGRTSWGIVSGAPYRPEGPVVDGDVARAAWLCPSGNEGGLASVATMTVVDIVGGVTLVVVVGSSLTCP